MADPLSFVASVIAVTTLASHVVIKGRSYIKAVMNCPHEVRTLMAEVDVLCGILERLTKILEGNKPNPKVAVMSKRPNGLPLDETHDGDETDDEDETVSSEDEEIIEIVDGTF